LTLRGLIFVNWDASMAYQATVLDEVGRTGRAPTADRTG
jgi:hypothetical protein